MHIITVAIQCFEAFTTMPLIRTINTVIAYDHLQSYTPLPTQCAYCNLDTVFKILNRKGYEWQVDFPCETEYLVH